ncbi:MAG TPA: hypothetical protein PLZ55_02750 [bacterium]|nr:hypothetical protein [bacterium]
MVEHEHHDGCCSCSLSRRSFLAASSAILAGPMIASAARGGAGDSDLGDYIDLAEFRPKPKVRIMGVVVRQKPPYWLGWPGTSYDLEGHRKEYRKVFMEAAERLGVEYTEDDEPKESDEAVAACVERLKQANPDAVLVHIQHLSYWHWADAIAAAGLPTIIFAPVGMAFTGHVLDISRRPKIHVISSLEVSAVEQAFRMVRAKKQLEETRLLVVAGENRSEQVLERLGITVKYVPRRSLHELFERMPETDEVREVARSVRRSAEKVVEPSKQDILNAARSYVTAKRLLKDEGCNAITTDCLGMVTTKVVPTPPCMAATLFQDAGITYGCEADLFAAVSLLFVSYLFDKPGFMQDPVPETVKNLLIGAHCTCGTRLNGFDQPPEPYILRSHSESNIGVATQILWKEGQPVTLVRFQNPNELILDSGTVVGNVQTPPAGGCRTSVEIKMDQMADARDVMGFHQAIFYGNHRRDVEAFCQMYGVRVVNSPEKAPSWMGNLDTITSWNIIGPFDNTGRKGHDTVYPPEQNTDLGMTCQGVDGPAKWTRISAPEGRGYVDLRVHFKTTEWTTAYALAYLHADQDVDAQLRVGSNDSLKVWLGGEQVYDYPQERGAVIDNDVIAVRIRAGWTPVLLKISNSEKGWGFYFRVTDQKGNACKEVKCALSPEV